MVEQITLRQAAEEWIRDHPVAMGLFRRFALEAFASKRRFGIGALAERVRWEYTIDVKLDPDDFKINNNWRAYIARTLIRENEGLNDLIECRVTKAANRPYRAPRVDPVVNPLDEGWVL